MNIVILDGFSVTQQDLDWHELQVLPNTQVTIYKRTSVHDTVSRCQEADAVLTNKVVLDRTALQQLPRLRYIGVLATGYNVVDLEAARECGIAVTNIPAYSTRSVAQLVFAHLLNVTNQVSHYVQENSQGRWCQSKDFMWMDTPLTELAGKTLGIRGLGNIGTEVARIGIAFGMTVLATTSKKKLPEGVESVSWETLLQESDVLSLHCPLTPETHHLINRRSLSRMKSTAILINTGRGPLVDEEALAEALASGRLGAYCADVVSQEPPSPQNPLLSSPRCYLTPHIAWATREARSRLIHVAVENVRAFCEGRTLNRVEQNR